MKNAGQEGEVSHVWFYVRVVLTFLQGLVIHVEQEVFQLQVKMGLLHYMKNAGQEGEVSQVWLYVRVFLSFLQGLVIQAMRELPSYTC
jgi:hypothetical protein